MKISKSTIVEQFGSVREASKRLGVTQPAIYSWIAGTRTISAEAAIQLEVVTNRAIRVEQLRPDIDWAFIRKGEVNKNA